MEPFFIGEIKMFSGNFAPRGWAFCEGQLLAISSHTALFSILGTTYGGDGRTTFALPDLRGRTAISAGTGPGLSNRRLGARSGVESNVLNILELANHNHFAQSDTSNPMKATVGIPAYGEDAANSEEPGGNFLSVPDVGGSNFIYSDQAATTALRPFSAAVVSGFVNVGHTGNNTPINNMMPWLALYPIIALIGPYPSRS